MSSTIVVAFDGSEGAERALVFAAAQARVMRTPIKLVAVVEWQFFGAQNALEMIAVGDDVTARIERYRKEILGPRCAALSSEGLDASFEIETGAVVPALETAATRCDAAQIVVGRRGGSKLSKLLLGSTSSALVQSAALPVTVVP